MPEYIKSITKTYKDYKKIIVYEQAWNPTPSCEKKKNKKSGKGSHKDKIWTQNVNRARTSIHDIVASNDFQYFVTLTISPKAKINRYNYDECAKALSIWLKHHLDRYILVPEKHKDKAYHFHLLADIPEDFLTHYKGSIYNIKKYKYGFSTAIKIKKKSSPRIANYIRKYITKELVSTVGKNRRRYWASKNLTKTQIDYNLKLPTDAVLQYEQQFIKIYHSPLNRKNHISDVVKSSL